MPKLFKSFRQFKIVLMIYEGGVCNIMYVLCLWASERNSCCFQSHLATMCARVTHDGYSWLISSLQLLFEKLFAVLVLFFESLGQPGEMWFFRRNSVLFTNTCHFSFPFYYRCMFIREWNRGWNKIKMQGFRWRSG